MKKLIFAIALSGLVAAPAFAQEGEPEKAKTPQEMLAELHKLMKKASEEMDQLERELAKASLDAPKADVVAERIEKARKAMAEGKIEDMPEGLRKHIEENPEEVAKSTGKSTEEVRKIAEDSKQLEELLKQNPELLKKLAENQSTMESITRRQHEAEKKLEETLKKQRESADAARQSVDDSIKVAHQLRQQGQGQGQGQPDNKGQKTQDPRQGQEQNQGGQQPNSPANGQYQPGDGKLQPENETEDFAAGQGDSAQMKLRDKDMKGGAGSDDKSEPAKYKNFWEKFGREIQKRTEDRKKKD